MSGAATRTTENKSAVTFEHSGMPSYAPGDSALESQGADGLRTAKLSQNSSSDVWAPTDCPTQVLPAELSDLDMLSGKCSERKESTSDMAKQGTNTMGESKSSMVPSRKHRWSALSNISRSASDPLQKIDSEGLSKSLVINVEAAAINSMPSVQEEATSVALLRQNKGPVTATMPRSAH